jgi:hypothetical protein
VTILGDIAAIVRRVTGDYTYDRAYPAVVQRVGADAVDVLPDDPTVQGLGLQSVPMPTIDPTTQLVPEPGCRCLLAFAGGDPRRPYISAWEYAQDSATVRLDGGSGAVARKGDLIDVILGATTPIAGMAGGTTVVPGTPPVVTVIPQASFTATATIVGPVRATPIGGAPKVKA